MRRICSWRGGWSKNHFYDPRESFPRSSPGLVDQNPNKPARFKKLRNFLQSLHRNGGTRTDLQTFIDILHDDKKLVNYPPAVNGYSKWWGKHELLWFHPPTAQIGGHGVIVSVRPELGLKIDGARQVIKLHAKKDTLARNRADIINLVIQVATKRAGVDDARVGVLDLRRSKPREPSGREPVEVLDELLDAELEGIARMFPNL